MTQFHISLADDLYLMTDTTITRSFLRRSWGLSAVHSFLRLRSESVYITHETHGLFLLEGMGEYVGVDLSAIVWPLICFEGGLEAWIFCDPAKLDCYLRRKAFRTVAPWMNVNLFSSMSSSCRALRFSHVMT